jgi:hypothetical protein
MAYLLVFPEKKQLYAVSENKMQATVINLAELLAQSEAQDSTRALKGTSTATPLEAAKTQKNDNVAGYPCERWNIQFSAVAAELCVAKQPTSWLLVPLGAATSKYSWAAELTDGNHFPLRLVTRLGGAEQGRIEVIRIEKKHVVETSFQVPSNYAVTTLAQLLSSLTLHTAPPSSTQ